MQIIKPRIEYWEQKDYDEHVARCGRVCYASDKTDGAIEFVNRIIKNSHLSVLRHGTQYFCVPEDSYIFDEEVRKLLRCEYVDSVRDFKEKCFWVAINGQVAEERPWDVADIADYEVRREEVFASPVGREIVRFSIYMEISVAIVSELNRHAPMNISQRSTRYCNYTNSKFGNNIKFVAPVWLINNENFDEIINNTYKYETDIPEHYDNDVTNFINDCCYSERAYVRNINNNMKPENARGSLNLNVMSAVVYTYSVKQWREIINKRYYGITGAPHPDVKYIMGEVKSLLESFGYDFEINL